MDDSKQTKVDMMYDDLYKKGYLKKDRETFNKFFYAPGEEGYKNRKAIYDDLYYKGYLESPTYEDFAERIGLAPVKRSQATGQSETPVADVTEGTTTPSGQVDNLVDQAKGAQQNVTGGDEDYTYQYGGGKTGGGGASGEIQTNDQTNTRTNEGAASTTTPAPSSTEDDLPKIHVTGTRMEGSTPVMIDETYDDLSEYYNNPAADKFQSKYTTGKMHLQGSSIYNGGGLTYATPLDKYIQPAIDANIKSGNHSGMSMEDLVKERQRLTAKYANGAQESQETLQDAVDLNDIEYEITARDLGYKNASEMRADRGHADYELNKNRLNQDDLEFYANQGSDAINKGNNPLYVFGWQTLSDLIKKHNAEGVSLSVDGYINELLKDKNIEDKFYAYTLNKANVSNQSWHSVIEDSIDDFRKALANGSNPWEVVDEKGVMAEYYGNELDRMDEEYAEELKEWQQRYSKWLKERNVLSDDEDALTAYLEQTGDNTQSILRTAMNLSHDARSTIDEAMKTGRGFSLSGQTNAAVRGFGNSAFDWRTWTFGGADASDNYNMATVAQKKVDGKPLTKAEQSLLDQMAIKAASDAFFNNYLTNGYKAGQTTGYALEFIVEMMTGAGEAADLATRAFGAFIKKLGKKKAVQMLERIGMKNVVEGTIKRLEGSGTKIMTKVRSSKFGNKAVEKAQKVGKFAGKALDETASIANRGLGQTFGPGIAKVPADAFRRMAGEAEPEYNKETGHTEFGGFKPGSRASTGEAFFKAGLSQFGENASEFLGDKALEPFLSFLNKTYKKVAGKTLDKLHLSGFKNFWNDLKGDDLYYAIKDFKKQIHYNGGPGEFLEEMGNNIYNAAFVGDMNWGTGDQGVFNWDNIVETYVSCKTMSAAFGTATAISYRTPRYRARKDIERYDEMARGIFSRTKNGKEWSTIADVIKNNNDEDRKKFIVNLMQDGSYTKQQKEIALKYAGAVYGAEGVDMGESKQQKSAGDQEASEAYGRGYNMANLENIKDTGATYQQLRAQMEKEYSYELMQRMDEEPGLVYDWVRQGAVSEEDAQKVLDYLNAKMAYEGAVDRINDDQAAAVAASDKAIDDKINPESKGGDGKIHPVVLKAGEKQVYVVDGQVATSEDGTVNTKNSSQTIFVMDEDGNVSSTTPDAIDSVGEILDPEQAKADARAQMDAAIASEETGEVEDNATVEEEGTPSSYGGVLDALGIEDEDTRTQWDEYWGQVPPADAMDVLLDAQGVTDAADRQNWRDYWESYPGAFANTWQQWLGNVTPEDVNNALATAKQQAAATQQAQEAQPTQQQQPTQATAGTYNYGDEVTLNVDGQQVNGRITHELDDNGKVGVMLDAPINGQRAIHVTPQELDAMTAPAAVEEPESAETPGQPIEQPSERTEEKVASDEGGIVSDLNAPMPMREVNGKQRVDYNGATPERAHHHIYNEKGYSQEEADQMVANTIASKQNAVEEKRKALEKAQKAKPKTVLTDETEDEYNAERAQLEAARDAAQQELDNAQRELEHWENIRKVEDARKAAAEQQEQTAPAEEQVPAAPAQEEPGDNGTRMSTTKSGEVSGESEETAAPAAEREETPEAVVAAALRERIKLRANELAEACGIPVTVAESLDDLAIYHRQDVEKQHKEGYFVNGFYDTRTNEIVLFLPDIMQNGGLHRLDVTYLHEGAAHGGLRALAQKNKGDFNKLCDEVWNSMSDADKVKYINYNRRAAQRTDLISRGDLKEADKKTTLKERRDAADEYMAHLAQEGVDQTTRDKVINAVRKFLRKIVKNLKLSDREIVDLLNQSRKYLTEMEKASVNQEAVDRLTAEAQAGTLTGGGIALSATEADDAAQVSKAVDSALGGVMEGRDNVDDPLHFSMSAMAEGAGFKAIEDDGNGNVAMKVGKKVFNGNNPITVNDIKSAQFAPINLIIDDARALGTATEEQIEKIYQDYVGMLNRMLQKGLKENGGFMNLAGQWRWIAETAFRTVHENSDAQYGQSIDISTICKKNEAVINAISKKQVRQGFGVTPNQILHLYENTHTEGYQVPCPVCYVFSHYLTNGRHATIMINGWRKYGDKMVDPSTLSEAEQKKLAKWFTKEYNKAVAWNDAHEKEISQAKTDIQHIEDDIDKLSKKILGGKLSKAEEAEARRQVETLDARYRAAVDLIAQSSLDKWIKCFAINVKKDQSKITLRKDSWRQVPDEMALDFDLTAESLRYNPGVQRLRSSDGSSGGKYIHGASNNEVGEVLSMLGLAKSERDAVNPWLEASRAKSEKERNKWLNTAKTRFRNAYKYMSMQSLRGGQRMWSWSDNIESLAPDVYINLMQLQLLGGTLQSYSKQLEGIDLVARMGGYVNGSLMGAGKGYRELTEDQVERTDDGLFVKDGDFVFTTDEGETVTLKAPVYEMDGKYYTLEFDDVVGVSAFGKIDEETGNHLKGLFELNYALDKAGNILVGMNDMHNLIAMADPRIYFIIPYHKSGLSAHMLMSMYNLIGVEFIERYAQNYEGLQEDTFIGADEEVLEPLVELWESHKNEDEFACGIEGGIPSDSGKLSDQQKEYRALRNAIFTDENLDNDPARLAKIKADVFLKQVYDTVRSRSATGMMQTKDTKSIYPYEYWDESSTIDNADVNGRRYVEYCRRLGVRPKFSGMTQNGKVSDHGNFVDAPGYWKTLIDRRMYDTQGNYQGLTAVDTAGFNVDLVDPEVTKTKFPVTKVADAAGTERIVDRTEAEENEMFGGEPLSVDYNMTGDQALKKYNKAVEASRESGLMFSTSAAPTFYSNAAKAVENIKQNKATAEQWLAMIKKNGGLKAGEDKWMGLSQWLEDNKGKSLTKEEVLQFVRDNGIQMEETEYVDIEKSPRLKELQDEYKSVVDNIDQVYQNAAKRFADFVGEMEAKYGEDYYDKMTIQEKGMFNVLSRDQEQADPTINNPHEIAMREMVDRYGDDFALAFDNAFDFLEINDNDAASYFLGDENAINSTRMDYTTKGLDNKREIAFVVPNVESYQEGDEIHFGPENQGKAVMWVRFGETTDADGKRVLVIDEIQSNRHQDAREKGYRQNEKKARELRKRKAEAAEQSRNIVDGVEQRFLNEGGNRIEFVNNGWEKYATDAEIAEYRRLTQLVNRLSEEQTDVEPFYNKDEAERIPSAPFEKNWHEVVMKRMLRLAAEEGFDKVAWTTGEQQAERYNLGRAFDSIEREDNPNLRDRKRFVLSGSNMETVETNNKGIVVGSTLTDAIGKDLSEVVGQSVAEKMMGLEDGDMLEGEDLRIGGEGMKGFYDSMLPRFMDKYGKRWGVKTGTVELPNVEEAGRTMHSVDVTPEMKDSVMQGQLLFSTSPDAEKTLMGVHNITAEKLKSAIGLGGLANPSMAVVDTTKGMLNNFGEISLIPGSALIDSKTGRNAGTFAADAYTPRFPKTHRRLGKGGDKKLKQWLKDLGMRQEMTYNTEEQFNDYYNGFDIQDNALVYPFLYERGMADAVDTYDHNKVSAPYRELISEYKGDLDALMDAFDNNEDVMQQVTDIVIGDMVRGVEREEGESFNDWRDRRRALRQELSENYLNMAGYIDRDIARDILKAECAKYVEGSRFNPEATRQAASIYIDKNGLREEYNKYRDEKLGELGAETQMYAGSDSQGRSKFKPVTLEGVSKEMKKQGLAGGESHFFSLGPGGIRARLTPRLTTLDQIRGERGRIQSDIDSILDEYSQELSDIASNVFAADREALADVLTASDMKAKAKELGYELEDSTIEQLRDFRERIAALPTEYFETKFERPVALNEFEAAIVPNDVDPEIREALEGAGLDVREYNPEEAGDREKVTLEAANDAGNVLFSVSRSLGAPYQGTKGRIATRIVDDLPSGERFVDLFAGGGAVTHAAILSGKYGSYHMNDINPVGQELFLQGVRGEWENYDRTSMTPEEFEKIKGTPESLPWSYNGLGRNLVKGGRPDYINRMRRLGELKDYADDITSSNEDYRNVEIKPGDVVYADIPYENTDTRGYGKGSKFDKQAFVDWAQAQDFPVFVSEYTMPEGWTEIDAITVGAMRRNDQRTEKLWVQDKFADQYRDGRVNNATDEDGIRFSVRQKPAPKKTQKVYKLMRLGDDGKLYPLFIDGTEPIELGVWYDADSPNMDMLVDLPTGVHLIDTENGTSMTMEEYVKQNGIKLKKGQKYPPKEVVKATPNGQRWVYIEPTRNAQRRFGGEARRYWNIGINGSGSVETYSMRPGWHAGSLPTMRQIGKGTNHDLRDDRFVWVEGLISADIDYNEEAQGNPDNDIPTHIPTDGYYLKATNANAKASQADRVGWYISGAFMPVKIMSDSEARQVIDEWNADPKHADLQVEYDFPRESGKVFNAETMQLEDEVRFSTSAAVDTLKSDERVYNDLLGKVFSGVSDATRRGIVDDAMRNRGYDFGAATEAWLSGLADNGKFAQVPQEDWDVVKNALADALGVNTPIADNEARYVLWSAGQIDDGVFSQARDIVMQDELWISEPTNDRADEPSNGDDGVMFSISPRDRAMARDQYERIMRSSRMQFSEAMQDSMLSLKKLMQSIMGDGRTKIEDIATTENPYIMENLMASTTQAQQHVFNTMFMKPILDEVGRLCKGKRKERERKERELNDYLLAKHGLERNLVFADRDAQETAAEGGNYQDAYAENREKDYAGLTALTGESDIHAAEAKAQQMVDDYEREHDTTELWARINAATQVTLEKQYTSGLLSKESYDKLRSMFEYYVPLRGWDETTSDEVYGYLTSNAGPFLGGSIVKHAEGRTSKADDPIATIAMMGNDSIRTANRNLMKQTFLDFVLNHPSDAVSVSELWLKYDDVTGEWVPVFADIPKDATAEEVEQIVAQFEQDMAQLAQSEPDKYKHGRETANIPYRVIPGNEREHQVLVKRFGDTYVLTINGNPRAAQALNGLTNPDVPMGGWAGLYEKKTGALNRFLSAVYTTFSPAFVMSNFLRDTGYSNHMVWQKEGGNYALNFHWNYLKYNPGTMRYLFGKWENGTLDESNPMQKMFKQFMLHGGETGFAMAKDLDHYKKKIAKELGLDTSKYQIVNYWNRMTRDAFIGKVGKVLAEQYDMIGRSVENCARFAAFVTSIQMGRSVERAAYDAKEISVNFNKKGSGGKTYGLTGQKGLGNFAAILSGFMRSQFTFWNAGVQGVTNFGRAIVRHPGRAIRRVVTPIFAAGFFAPILASIMGAGGGDDDDKNAYYNLPDYVRRSNLCIYLGGLADKFKGTWVENYLHGTWLTIPLPVEFRSIYGLGELTYGVISGNERYSAEECLMQYASQFSQLLPIDMLEGGGGFSAFVPTWWKPISAIDKNVSWSGTPIYKDNPYNQKDPEWTKAFSNTSEWLVDATEYLNSIPRFWKKGDTGGDEFKKGWIDWNPANIEYLLKGYLGGAYTFPNDAMKAVNNIFGEDEFEWRNVPFANRVLKQGDERLEARKLKEDYFRYKEEADDTKRLLDKYGNAPKSASYDYAKKLDLLNNSKEYGHYRIFKDMDGLIQSYRNARKKIKDPELIKEYEDLEVVIMRQMVNMISDYNKGKEVDSEAATEAIYMAILEKSSDKELLKEAGKQYNKAHGTKDSFASSKTKYNQRYFDLRKSEDVKDDSALQKQKTNAKKLGDKDLYKAYDKASRELTNLRKELGQGTIRDDMEIMDEIRSLRKEILGMSKEQMLEEYGPE